MKTNFIPDGYHTATPYLIVNSGTRAIEFYQKAFGATEVLRVNAPGGKLGHAEIQIGDSRLMLADEFPEWDARGPEAFGGRKAGGNVNGAAFDPGGTTSFSSTYPDRIILVTSTLPGEGKSMTSASLARALARSGKRVILVNADMRRPALDQSFPVSGSLGLADVLERRASLADALERSVEHNLLVLHSGQVTDSPTNLLSRPALAHLIHELRSAGCTVLIDTPASAVVGDALLLAPHADGILHVVGVGQVEEEILGRTTAALHAAAPGVLAYFVNRLPHERRAAYGGYYRPFAAAAAPATNAQTAAADGQGARSVASLWDEGE